MKFDDRDDDIPDNLNTTDDSEFFLNFPEEESQDSISDMLDSSSVGNKLPVKLILISALAIIAVAFALWGSFKLGKFLFASKLNNQSASDVYSAKDNDSYDTLSDEDKSADEFEAVPQNQPSENIEPKTEAKDESLDHKTSDLASETSVQQKTAVFNKVAATVPAKKPASPVKATIAPVHPKSSVQKPQVVAKPALSPKSEVKLKSNLSPKFDIIAGSYSTQQIALKEVRKLATLGFNTTVSSTTASGKTTYRVHIGSKLTREEAKPLQQKAKSAGYDTFLLPR